jgi:hypothetical protein
MKRSFERSLLFLLVLGIGLAGAALSAQDPKPFIGDWKGAVFIQATEIGLVAHFTLDENKNIAGTLDSPSQNAYGLKLADIKIGMQVEVIFENASDEISLPKFRPVA